MEKEQGVARVLIAGTLDFAGGDVCAQIIRGAAGHIAASRKESGCIAYDWAADPLMPGRIHVFESWESETALGAHFRHSSYFAMRAHLAGHQIVGFDVKLYSVAGIEPVYTDDGQHRDVIFGVTIG
jgi:quinol monooxygenase YgiN